MPLIRRVATLGAAVAAARQYARQNPDKVNRYADQAASFLDQRTNGRFRKQIDGVLRQVRKETSIPGRGTSPSQAGQYGPQQTRNDPYSTGPRRYPSERTDR